MFQDHYSSQEYLMLSKYQIDVNVAKLQKAREKG